MANNSTQTQWNSYSPHYSRCTPYTITRQYSSVIFLAISLNLSRKLFRPFRRLPVALKAQENPGNLGLVKPTSPKRINNNTFLLGAELRQGKPSSAVETPAEIKTRGNYYCKGSALASLSSFVSKAGRNKNRRAQRPPFPRLPGPKSFAKLRTQCLLQSVGNSLELVHGVHKRRPRDAALTMHKARTLVR